MANVHRICADTHRTCFSCKNCKHLHEKDTFLAFFLMINGHIWQVDFETAMFSTKKMEPNIGNKEILDHVLSFEAKIAIFYH